MNSFLSVVYANALDEDKEPNNKDWSPKIRVPRQHRRKEKK
jgi:hypothetical protein